MTGVEPLTKIHNLPEIQSMPRPGNFFFFFFFFFFLRDLTFKKTLFEKLQYLKQEQNQVNLPGKLSFTK